MTSPSDPSGVPDSSESQSPSDSPQSPAPTKKPRKRGTLARTILLIRSNWISTTGALFSFFGFLSLVMTILMEQAGVWSGPYLGIMTMIVFPALFLGGAAAIPVGLVLYRKRLHRRLEQLSDRPVYLVRAVIIVTIINVVALGTIGSTGVHYMSSVQFCGSTCHQVMGPEAATHAISGHAKVDCVACHVGPGAQAYFESKMNGTKQLYEVLTNKYRRPIPTPIERRRSARETCETCHWSQKFQGTKLSVFTHFRDDEKVTPFTSVLLMKTGGNRPKDHATGIHWHIHPKSIVQYVATDEKLTEIPWIHVKRPDGTEATFATKGVPLDPAPEGEKRTMDCIDCHNRTAHDFETAEDVVDKGLLEQHITTEIPFMRVHALDAIEKEWTSENVATGILNALLESCGGDEGIAKERLPLIKDAAAYLTKKWRQNVFPEMKIGWNLYDNHQSHEGCFRCHDDEHEDAKGNVISKDCSLCHEVLSNEEPDPEVLKIFNGGGSKK